MIVAIVLAEPVPTADGEQPYFNEHAESTVLDQAVSRVLRGPFGGTVVATTSEFQEDFEEILEGFAVKYAITDDPAFVAKAGLLEASAFRKRWEKIMAGAAQRFGPAGKPSPKKGPQKSQRHDEDENDAFDDEDLDGDEQEDGDEPDDDANTEGGASDWKTLSKSGDVKVRGLARSFDCDGVMLFRGDRPSLKLETQATLIDTFVREGAGKNFARVSFEGQPGYPVLANLAGLKELEALPLHIKLDDWLTQKAEKILAVPVQDPAIIGT
jgi:hypothetical protein